LALSWSRFFTYSEETLVGEVVTELHRALLELGVTLITHLPGNARAKGKIERLFRLLLSALSLSIPPRPWMDSI